jgi:hypothetical protein
MRFMFRRQALIAALRDAWPVWLAIAGILVAAFFGWVLSHDASAGVLYAGATLEMFGLGTVAFGLSEVRRSFGRPSLREKCLAWLSQVASAFRPPKPITLQANAGLEAIVGVGARLIVRAGPGSSLDQRVAILEENLNRLRDEVDANESKIKREVAAVREALSREQQARDNEVRRMAAHMEELAVGGLHLELVGLTWLVFGGLGTSIPGEVARLLCWLSAAALR